jgi:hypothetical protein
VGFGDAMIDKLQTQRYERKYFVSQKQALQIREFLRHYLEPDEYSIGKPNLSYPIHSIYLDSDLLTTYWATVHGEKNRFKLRLRFYDDNPDSPVFFELKGRMNECILKQRAPVRKDAAATLVAGQYPGLEHLLDPKPRNLVSVQKFCQLMQALSAQPKLHVAYLREAWLPRDDNFLRVTMDREIRGSIEHHVKLNTKMVEPFRPHPNYTPYGDDTVILELKYTHYFPEWYRDLVCLFNLLQTGAPKYGSLVMGIGEERISAPDDWNSAMPRTRWQKQF